MEPTRSRNAPPAVTIGLAIFGVLLIVVAIVYFTQNASSLPSFFPGHQAGSARHHTKHGLAAIAVAVVCFIGAWISTGHRPSAAVGR